MELPGPQASAPPPDIPAQATIETPASSPAISFPDRKPIHSLVLDAGPIIKNDPPVSSLLAQATELYTIPSVVSEIRDVTTRTRVETTLLPFVKLRSPRAESIKFVTDFARRTGDLEVLSRPDLHLIALTYELECERNGGDWRLRKTPAQKNLNGKPPVREGLEKVEGITREDIAPPAVDPVPDKDFQDGEQNSEKDVNAAPEGPLALLPAEVVGVEENLESLSLDSESKAQQEPQEVFSDAQDTQPPEEASDSGDDSDGWITPSNLKKHQAQDDAGGAPTQPIQKLLQAALLTSDFAMQNVALRINLNLLNTASLERITRVKTWVLRCHGCFAVTRQTARQFCPACGQPTLTRTSCSTDSAGQFKIHLKRNYQYNKRGNVYSVPKPVHGSSSGKAAGPGGGKNGWGRELVLAEDQKEYVRHVEVEKRTRYRDVMDEDYLPGILTGERSGGRGRIRVGAGRNVNSKKR